MTYQIHIWLQGLQEKTVKKKFSNGIAYFFLLILVDFYSENNNVSQVLLHIKNNSNF
jgi:hypothetical protein